MGAGDGSRSAREEEEREVNVRGLGNAAQEGRAGTGEWGERWVAQGVH